MIENTTIPVSEDREASVIATKIETLRCSIEVLSDKLAELERKLGPALAPVQDSEMKAMAGNDRKAQSVFAHEVENSSERVYALTEQVRELIYRLEL